MAKTKLSQDERRKFYTLFHLFVPTIFIIAVGIVVENPMPFLAVALIIAFYQFVGLKNFADTHYN